MAPNVDKPVSSRGDFEFQFFRRERAELDHREATLLAQFRSVVLETEELQDGYAFRIPGDTESIRLAANLIVAERGCCRFSKFELIAGPNQGPVIARLTGPAATKEFLRTILYKTEEST